jgi:hypothetical protein
MMQTFATKFRLPTEFFVAGLPSEAAYIGGAATASISSPAATAATAAAPVPSPPTVGQAGSLATLTRGIQIGAPIVNGAPGAAAASTAAPAPA